MQYQTRNGFRFTPNGSADFNRASQENSMTMIRRAYARLNQTWTGFSDSPYTSNYLMTDGQLKKLAAVSPSIDETHTGSRNWEKARLKVVKEQRKIADQRKDFHHKLSRAIADNCTAFICEDLAVKNMMKNRHLAKAIASVGWSQFLTMVKI